VTFALTAAANEPAPQVSIGIDAGLAEVFEEYRVSSEGEGEAATNGDYETHYNLGLAYKEMDLFEDALEEFQIAASLSAPGDGTSRYVQCCNLLGHCFTQTGVPELAVKWFSKGLNAPGVSDEERLALGYELGAAYEQAGDLNRALEFFTEVYGTNVSYRSVNERVRTLKTQLGEKAGVPQKETRSEQLVN
jgi:pilus assembly protein FimV